MTAPLVSVETSVTGFLPCEGTPLHMLGKGGEECFLPATWTMRCTCVRGNHRTHVLCADCVRDFLAYMRDRPQWHCNDHDVQIPVPAFRFGEL